MAIYAFENHKHTKKLFDKYNRGLQNNKKT